MDKDMEKDMGKDIVTDTDTEKDKDTNKGKDTDTDTAWNLNTFAICYISIRRYSTCSTVWINCDTFQCKFR